MRVILAVVFILGATCLTHGSLQKKASPYTYVCRDKKCQRTLKDNSTESETSMNVCKLNCDDVGNLWPKPTGEVSLGKESPVAILPSSITLENLSSNPVSVQSMLQTAFDIFKSYFPKPNPSDSTTATHVTALQNRLQVHVNVLDNSTDIGLSVDESYSLRISATEEGENITLVANISATTYFGARHGLETLSQLIAYDDIDDVLKVIRNVSITDKPVFPYRGIMLDTSRNYLSVGKIKKIIDGMSYNKLSVFHWHITDSHSFPMEVHLRPQMTEYGAYAPDKIYSMETIRDVVSYARQRGVKVIPEIDQPAHSGYGYQWGPKEGLGDLVVCVDHEPWYDFCVEPPCGQLNIVNENVLDVLGDIFTGMMDVFDKDIFHMGGDEVDFRCYNDTKEITDWMLANNYSLSNEDFYKLWGVFQDKMLGRLLNATSRNDTKIIMWTSGLTDPSRIETYLDKSRYIIQIWSDSEDANIGGLLQRGYKAIFSNVNALYLDCGFQAWLGDGHNWCSPVKGWQTVYDNNPEKIYASFTNDSVAGDAVRNGQIVGSETPLWAEQVDDKALESRIWPRAAAHAERMWSHPDTTHSEAEFRMVANRDRMVSRGIDADRLQPEFCLQNEGRCYDEKRGPGAKDGSSITLPCSIVTIIMMTLVRLV